MAKFNHQFSKFRQTTNSCSVNNYLDSIALLGTSADPPTCGHEALLKGLLTLFPKVITWASNNPLKEHATSLETRHELLKALVEDIDNPQLEIIQGLSSPWTITTLEKATSRWPKANFVFVIGSDLAQEIPNWLQVKDLLKKARIAIAIREGWPLKQSQINKIEVLGGKIDLLPLTIPASSSSIFRENFKTSQIPKAILPLLKNQKLYGLTNSSQ